MITLSLDDFPSQLGSLSSQASAESTQAALCKTVRRNLEVTFVHFLLFEVEKVHHIVRHLHQLSGSPGRVLLVVVDVLQTSLYSPLLIGTLSV